VKKLALVLLFPVFAAHASGWSTADRSAGAMGVAGAATARTDEPGYNAAAAMMRPGLSLLGGTLLARPSLSASGDGISASTDGGVSTPPHVFARWANDTIGAGVSLTVPFGSQIEWPADWARRFDLVEARISVLRVGAQVGWHNERFAISAGPFIDVGSLALVKAIDFVEAEGRASIDTKAVGAGAMISAFAHVTQQIDLGLTYTSRSSLSLKGWADFTTPPELRGRALDQEVSASVTTPDRIALGGVWRLAPGWDVSLDLEMYLWSTIDELVIDFAEPSMSDTRQPRDWGVTVTPRVGATWSALEWLSVRGGFYLDPSPVPSSTLGPSSPDSLRIGAALGAGLAFSENVGLDVGSQLVVFTGNKSASGVDFGGVALLAGASLRIAFPE